MSRHPGGEGSVRSGEARLGGADLEKPGVAAPGGGGKCPGHCLHPQVPQRPARIPGAMRVQVKVNAAAPNTFPQSPPLGSAPSSTLPTAGGSLRELRAGPPDSCPKCDGKFFFFVAGKGGRPWLLGSLEGAWGIVDRSGDPGCALVSCEAARTPRTGYHLPVLCGLAHMCEVVRFIVRILFWHFLA